MKIALLLSCLLLLSIPSIGQWEWVKVFPRKHQSIEAKIDSKGNFYILASYNPYQIGPYVIYKLDNNANFLAEKVLPINLSCTSFEMRSDDQLFIGGYFKDTLQIDQYTVVSKGKEDGIIIRIGSNLQASTIRTFGGKFDDRVTGIACDNQKRLFVVGGLCDTAKVDTQTLLCNQTGNSFLARFSTNLQLNYIVKDSTHENTNYDHWLAFSSVQVNNNGDILIGGVGKGKNYYSFCGTKINILPDYYYHYYRSFAIQLDSNLNTHWSRADQWGKYSSCTYVGFTNSNVTQFSYYGSPGNGSGCELSEINSTGVVKKLNVSTWGGKYSMGSHDNRFYFHRSFEVLDTSVHDYVQRNELFALLDTQAILIDTVAGGIGSCKLLRSKTGEAYVTGIFIGPVAFGQHSVSTGVNDHKIFIAKLGQSFNVGIIKNRDSRSLVTIGPNPTDRRLSISVLLEEDASAHILSIGGQRFDCRVDGKEIFLPELPAGIYIIVIDSAKSRITKKIVIR